MCKVCDGYNSCACPVCGPVSEMRKCPDCDGEGVIYYDANGKDDYTREEWEQLPIYMRMGPDECDRCDGTGEIATEYEDVFERMARLFKPQNQEL